MLALAIGAVVLVGVLFHRVAEWDEAQEELDRRALDREAERTP